MSVATYARHALLMGALGLLSLPDAARADTAATCKVSGSAPMPASLAIYDKSQGGTPIARFTGGNSEIVASKFFSGRANRAQVKTGTGVGSFRIEGWVDGSKLPLYAARDIAVVNNHLWISKHQSVKAISAAGSKLRIKHTPSSPFNQSFTTTVSCKALSLRGGTAAGWTPPGSAVAYVAKSNVELFTGSGADNRSVATLTPDSSSNGILFFSTETSNGYVHVLHHGEVVIDAWAKKSELNALAPGETMDQPGGSTLQRGSPRIKLQTTPRLVHTTKEVILRSTGSDTGDVIGAIEADTDTYVLDVVAGWASVMPKSMNVAPYGDGQFWARATDIGAAD